MGFRYVFIFIFSLIALNLFSGDLTAQESFGKIFTRTQADSLFGPVIGLRITDTTLVKSLTGKAGNYIMFKLENSRLTVLDSKRSVLYSDNHGTAANSTEVFHNFSASVLRELIKRGQKSTIFIEKRRDVLSITNGGYTMEAARPCPPYCPD